nr:hypothetical protein [Tanacetum cinerariifolium]
CPPKVPIISNSKPCYNQKVDEFPQTLPSFHPTCYSGDENSFTYDSNLNFMDDSPNPPKQPPMYSYEFCGNDAHYGHDCPPQVPFIYNSKLVTIKTLTSHKIFKVFNNNIFVVPAIDSLPDEFVGELIFLKSIPPGIDEADCDPEEEIRLIKKLLIAQILKTRARGFVLRSLDLHILNFN